MCSGRKLLVHLYFRDAQPLKGNVLRRQKKSDKFTLDNHTKPVESSSPLGWPAGGGQLGLAAVSLLDSQS
jgi:hypothetical protein